MRNKCLYNIDRFFLACNMSKELRNNRYMTINTLPTDSYKCVKIMILDLTGKDKNSLYNQMAAIFKFLFEDNTCILHNVGKYKIYLYKV